MTSRLILHLSGAWTKHQDALLEDGDLLCRMPGLSTVSQKDGWQELPRSSRGDNKALLDQYIGLFAGLEDRVSSVPFMSLVNDQFIHSVTPTLMESKSCSLSKNFYSVSNEFFAVILRNSYKLFNITCGLRPDPQYLAVPH
jgi:hypothetical protein